MRAGIVAGCFGLALLASGCDTTNSRYFSFGVGTNLYSEDIVQTTQFQDIYLTQLCRQALPVLSSSEAECLNTVSNPALWNLIVQAGLNDVDRRCDAYLAWLDDRRRTNNAVLKELGDLTVASMAIMRVTGVGANPITLAGLAFGLASNTFTNINSRLLLEVDKTTVNTLVMRRRGEFRLDLKTVSIADRPAAIYIMRQYLTICTPFAIETDINSTITVFQQVGRGGLDNKGPLLNPDAVLRASTDTGKAPTRPKDAPVVQPFKDIIVNYDPNVHTTRYVTGIVRKLCLADADAKNVAKMTSAIQVFQMTLRDVDRDATEQITGRLSDGDLLKLNDVKKPCDLAVFANFYETRLSGGIRNADVVGVLNRALTSDKRLAATASASDVRARIVEIRQSQSIGPKLTLRGPSLLDQLTPDMVIELNKLPPV